MSTKQDAASEARAIEEPVAPKRAWGPVLRGEARARLARYDAAVKREADLCAADPERPRGQLLLAVDREVFAAMLARLDALAPLAEAADEHELTALRLADAQARVARLEEVVTAHVGEVRRQCARIEELETELASRPLALARGER